MFRVLVPLLILPVGVLPMTVPSPAAEQPLPKADHPHEAARLGVRKVGPARG
ncbi:MAG: hypothetical protein U0792_07425 [Gemmataceae bacterium]